MIAVSAVVAGQTVGIRDALLIAIVGGSFGSLIGGLVTWLVTREQVRADVRRQWREVAAGAYATTLAVASSYNPQTADAAAVLVGLAGKLPESYYVTRSRASEALADLERTSVLSDNAAVQSAVEALSATLREMDRKWSDLIDWHHRLSQMPTSVAPAARKNIEDLIHGLNLKLDEYLARMYGTGGLGPGLLDSMRDALRETRQPAWWRGRRGRRVS